MTRDFKMFMSGFIIASFIFGVGMWRLVHKVSIDMQYQALGGKIK